LKSPNRIKSKKKSLFRRKYHIDKNGRNDFDKYFLPIDYLKHYYCEVDINFIKEYITDGSILDKPLTGIGQENAALLIFYADIVLPLLKREKKKYRVLLDVGSGATVYQFISLATVIDSIYFTDYLDCNLKSVKNWKRGKDDFWHEYIRGVLILEKRKPDIEKKEILQRERLIKGKLKHFGIYDAIKDKMETDISDKKFDIVSSNFCIESITDQKKIWFSAFNNLTGRLKQRGRIIIMSLRGASGYPVSGKVLPAVEIYECDLMDLMKKGFRDIIMKSIDCESKNKYQGIIFVTAVKK